MSEIEQAARGYLKRGWIPLAQGDGADGRVGRRPIFRGWNTLTKGDPNIRKQGWRRATGIGLLTGSATGLVALDIDNADFARAVFSRFVRSGKPFCWQWTPSGGAHAYFSEVLPSLGTSSTAFFEGQEVRVDLKSNNRGDNGEFVGSAITVHPTPGYIWATKDLPQPVETLEKAWMAVCLAMGATPVEKPVAYEPWRDFVPDGEKNNGLYTEARALAISRMPYERAVEILRINAEQNYGSRMAEREFIDTIRSAYRRFWRNDSVAENPRYAR